MKPNNLGGRPKEIEGETRRVSYNVTCVQANYIVNEAIKNEVSESEIIRRLITIAMTENKGE